MQQPMEIDVEEDQQIVERVAAIDVAKATGMVCTRVPHGTVHGRRVTKVWEVKATTRALVELADHLVAQGIQRTILESTSDYWRPFYYILEAAGLEVWLVNAAQAKNVRAAPSPTRSTRCGWPNWPNGDGIGQLRAGRADAPGQRPGPSPLRPGRRPHPGQTAHGENYSRTPW